VAGVLCCLLRMLLLITLGDSDRATNLGTVIFFIISAILILLSLLLSIVFYRTALSKKKLKELKLINLSEIRYNY